MLDGAQHLPGFRGAVLVGSLAKGEEAWLSDIDLLVFIEQGRFAEAWANRRALRSRFALLCWDGIGSAHGPRAHKWITPDLVMVDCLLGEPAQVRVANPFLQLAGSSDLLNKLRRREPIERTEMRGPTHPVERSYDQAKTIVRSFARWIGRGRGPRSS